MSRTEAGCREVLRNRRAYLWEYASDWEREANRGKFLLMSSGRVVDVFDEKSAAYDAGVDRYGLGSFSVTEVLRDVRPLDSYGAGVILTPSWSYHPRRVHAVQGRLRRYARLVTSKSAREIRRTALSGAAVSD